MIRKLRKHGKLYSVAIFSLSIAMALTVTGLSLTNAILLRPPAARDAGRLVHIFTIGAKGGKEGVSHPDYVYLRDHNRSLAGLAAFNYGLYKYELSYQGRYELAMMDAVSDNYFAVMGIQPWRGQFFAAGDDQRKAAEAVLTYACWQRWGADPEIAGKTLLINRAPVVILGVAPREFLGPEFGLAADVMVNLGAPQNVGGAPLDDREMRAFLLVGRLRRGVERGPARAELRTLWGQLAAAYPVAEHNRGVDLAAASVLRPDEVAAARTLGAVLVAAVLLILLIACANTANLLLALATGRRQEALIKTALGASRRRLVAESLRETLVLCAVGGVVGYALASATLRAISRFDVTLPMIGTLPISADLHPGLLVAAATLALIALASLASGLAPALYGSRPDLAGALSGEMAAGGTRRGPIRAAVVVVQVAVCTLVLVGTGICLRSVHNLRQVDPGFSARRLLMLSVFLETPQVSKEQGIERYEALRRGAAGIAGVEAVALANDLPLGGEAGDRVEIRFADRPPGAQKIFTELMSVDESYFSTMGIRLLAGRVFRASDTEKSPEVVVVNRCLAERFWPGQEAVGRTLRIVDNSRKEGSRPVTVAGLVADGKYDNLDEPQQTFLYLALGQHYEPQFRVILRTAGDPRRWSEPASRMVRSLGVQLPVAPIPLDAWMNLTLFVPLVTLASTVGLSVLAVLLAAVGLYGAISYSVSGRRRELGIRIALGARPAQLMRLVFRETLAMTGGGVLAGAALGVAAGDLFRSRFYGIHRLEWPVLAPVAAAVVAAALAIAFLAARRWTRMDPMDAVRHG